MIDFACPHCGMVYAVAAEHAGRDALCGRCRAVIAVPAGAPREVVYAAPPPPEPEFGDPAPGADRRTADRRRTRARRKTVLKLALLVLCVAGIAAGMAVIRERVRWVDQGKARVGW